MLRYPNTPRPLCTHPRPQPLATPPVACRVICAWLLLASSLVTLTLLTVTSAQAQLGDRHGSGQMTLRDDRGTLTDALLVDTDVTMSVHGMVATVTYQQQFYNASDSWVEGRYVFPLPETAAVSAMTLRIGERVIVGEIQEKQAARATYEQARNAGQRASLVEQQRANLFSQQVANIGPGERVDVTLTYRQAVDYQHGRFSLRLPLTITPRYLPGDPVVSDAEPAPLAFTQQGWAWSTSTDQVGDADRITPPMTDQTTRTHGSLRNPVTIAIDLAAGLPLARIDSPYHDVVIHKQGAQHSIRLSEGRAAMDRDFVLTWQPVAQPLPRAALFTEHVDAPAADAGAGDDYLLLMLLPPAADDNDAAAALPREVTFIIDTSGSMAGAPIQQAKASLQLALTTLSDRDRFNIVEFNSGFRRYSAEPQSASADNLHRAQAFVARLQANGGTEMYAPLDAVLSAPANEGLLKQVIFITDGSVGNEAALFGLIENKLGSARLFLVGIGSAPNSYFMRKSAQFGRGTFTHVGDVSEVAERMSELFHQLQAPLLRDIRIDWPEDIEVESFPRQQPDLYAGQPLLLKARIRPATAARLQAGTVTVAGQTAQGPWSQSLPLTLRPRAGHTGIASLWARDKIAALMDQQHTGTAEADIKPQVLAVALSHQLLSAYTSFVAVDKTPARPAEAALATEAIPNRVAHGQVPQAHTLALSYPQTALGLDGKVYLASALILAALCGLAWQAGARVRSPHIG